MGSGSISGGFGILYRSAGLSGRGKMHRAAEYGDSQHFRADYKRDYRDTCLSGSFYNQDAPGVPVHPFFGNYRGKNERIEQTK